MVDLRKALNEGTDSEGGYFVPEEYAKRFIDLVERKSTAIPLMEHVNMKYDVQNIPSVTDGNTGYFTAELADITGSDFTSGQTVLTAKKLAALTNVSTEVLEDSDPSIGNIITNRLAKAVALKLDNEIYNGTGTNFSGIRDTTTYTDTNTVAAAGADGDAISYDKIVDGQTEIQVDDFEGGTHLIMNPKILAKVRLLKDGNSRPLFDEATWGSPMLKEHPKAIGSILGLQVVITTALPVNLTKGSGTTLSDAVILTKGEGGIYGTRRQPRFHKEYQITSDAWKIQTNLRSAFIAKYQKSTCIIEDLITAI